MSASAEVPAALAAFVRGVERRAWLFLWLQGGDEAAAGPALAAALRAFSRQAAAWPMAEWPLRFWRLMAASPTATSSRARWPDPLQPLGEFDVGPRRALLLRLVAGLDEVPAAQVLGLDVAGYQHALGEAVARDSAGEVDIQAWHALAQAVQLAGRELPARRLLAIAQLRETALFGGDPATADVSAQPSSVSSASAPPRRRWPWIAAVLVACVLALLATLLLHPTALNELNGDVAGEDALRVMDNGPILVEELPLQPHPGTLEPMADVVPAVLDPLVTRFDLLAWYIAGAADSQIEREGGLEGVAIGVAAETGPPILPDRIQAWQALSAQDHARIRAAALAFDALAMEEQEELRVRFGMLDQTERRGWQLGPELGQDWPRLHPLLGYVLPEQRDRLLESLYRLSPEQRQALAELGRRGGTEGRQDFLARWLLVPAEQRRGWLQQEANR